MEEVIELVSSNFIKHSLKCLTFASIMVPLYTPSIMPLMVLLRETLVKSNLTSNRNIHNHDQTF